MDGPERDRYKTVVAYRPLLGSFRAEPPEVRDDQGLQGVGWQRVPYLTVMIGRTEIGPWIELMQAGHEGVHHIIGKAWSSVR